MNATNHDDDPLDDFAARAIELEGATRRVYVGGRGPGVIVMAEMPGISPDVARFARWVWQAGFTVYMPSLFGRDGAYPQAEDGLAVLRRACVSAEFHALAGRGASPVTRWLRALARLAREECGGPGVGAVGMCFTGNFALSMMLEQAVLAPVLAQPSLPFDDAAAVESDTDELRAVRARLERDDLSVLAYRFAGDRHCRAERFAAYASALGRRFVGNVLPDAAANPRPSPFFKHIVGCQHSVLTAHLVDEEGSPTLRARDEVVAFLRTRLLSANAVECAR
ncbi:dienelactone hydrolase family protein [Rudaea sp.]|uniref:dienelactone hydrolase family protein n=1 Tax=Rudaea sp. TaxID=2136325 RepID=UPI00321FD38F